MPRANRRRPAEPRLPMDRRDRGLLIEAFQGRDWIVRHLRASDSGKSYLCPGCQQQVSSAIAHVVTWPADGMNGLEDRRHWHTRCWTGKGRRRPTGALM